MYSQLAEGLFGTVGGEQIRGRRVCAVLRCKHTANHRRKRRDPLKQVIPSTLKNNELARTKLQKQNHITAGTKTRKQPLVPRRGTRVS